MALFQESIVRKYLSTLDPEMLEAAFEIFKKVYSPSKIQNIKILKEEQYQEGFIKDVFGSVLGYSIFPEENYNIETEKKNEADAKKADGAILKDDKVIGVIELKDNKTKNLDSVKDQAFGYKHNHKDCSYVISSNFHKLRFYVDDATEYEEFDLYNLDKETFRRFYLYLRKEGLLDKNIPKLLRQETKFHEENITKNLYKDYSQFKNNFFQNAVKNNPQFDKLTLFKKSQKFLDKLLFVLFAEDKNIITTNSVVRIVEKWNDLKNDAFDNPKPLFQLVSLFFNNLYTGKKDQNGNVIVPEFGGELFAPDPVLDTLMIEDDILANDLLRLSKYDYNTEVDVNILGHIFEHSLNEIEEVEAELRGEAHDKTKGKRKKEGIFYTPKYITKYIVNNTLGKLCQEKKEELGIEHFSELSVYLKTDGKLSEKGKGLFERLNKYKSWLLGLKILDPACGSGAFLNEAVNFLIDEHRNLDDIIAELTNTPLRLFDTDFTILENNIYGVDINEESVEIAKLSLWLRTARPNRKLNDLSNNIKCGNSLIDDPAVARDKAFDWQQEFPQVFKNDGFDVVIGNPPYGSKLDKIERDLLAEKYECFNSNFDIYSAFIQLAFQLSKIDGIWGFINPVSWQSGENYLNLRKYFTENGKLEIGVKLPYDVFNEAYVDTGIYIVRKSKSKNYISCVFEFPVRYKYSGDLTTDIKLLKLPSEYWLKLDSLILVFNPSFYELLPKVYQNAIQLGAITSSIRGILPSEGDVRIMQHAEDKLYFTGDIYRYKIHTDFQWVRYGDHLKEKPKDYNFFRGDRILIRRLINRQFRIMATFVEDEFVNKKDIYNLKVIDNRFDIKYILAIINSKLISFLKTKGSATATKDDFGQLALIDIRQIPIMPIDIDQQKSFIQKVDALLSLSKSLQETSNKFHRNICRRFELVNLPANLFSWYKYSYAEFIQELKKKKVKLSLSDEAEWEAYFTQESAKALAIKDTIQTTDKEIDQMVYALYGLTDDEIKIVEGLS